MRREAANFPTIFWSAHALRNRTIARALYLYDRFELVDLLYYPNPPTKNDDDEECSEKRVQGDRQKPHHGEGNQGARGH
jgi:hypothetical protein